jgi:hypothetical protein
VGPTIEEIRAVLANHGCTFTIIVVDDGSTDATAQIVEASQTRLIRRDHCGLGAARNAGIEAAAGDIVTFIDADARADADWLYHLVEAITRRGAAAAGGPNFAPPDCDAASALAPGIPREVRGEGDQLTQLCGCNLAITKAALQNVGGFDPSFAAAGDDVDLSWRLAELPADKRAPIVSAPGAVVIHQRRTALGDYLRQQRGYGAGEGLLYKKYPLRTSSPSGLYGGAGTWLSALLGGPRVYHGTFGRGLFQSMYAGADLPWLAELPQTFEWIAASALLAILGVVSGLLGALGCLGIIMSIATAILSAAFAHTEGRALSPAGRAQLALLYMVGPLVRSFERERVRFALAPAAYDLPAVAFSRRGRIIFSADEGAATDVLDSPRLLAEMRAALVRYGLAIAVTDGYQAWDLNVVLAPAIRVPLNALRISDGTIALAWRTKTEPTRMMIAAAIIFIVLLACGWSAPGAFAATALIAGGAIAPAIVRLQRVVSLLAAASEAIAGARGLKTTVRAGEIF